MIQSDEPIIATVKRARTSYGDSGSGLCGLGGRARGGMPEGFRRGMTAKLPSMTDRDELRRHLTIFAVTAPGAAVVWWIFHGVYENLTISAKAVGYVDPMTQAGIDFGYLVMIVGTVLLAIVAVRSAFICVRLLLRRQR
jgi:hypothetical protein